MVALFPSLRPLIYLLSTLCQEYRVHLTHWRHQAFWSCPGDYPLNATKCKIPLNKYPSSVYIVMGGDICT